MYAHPFLKIRGHVYFRGIDFTAGHPDYATARLSAEMGYIFDILRKDFAIADMRQAG